jgi:hypothetical protein
MPANLKITSRHALASWAGAILTSVGIAHAGEGETPPLRTVTVHIASPEVILETKPPGADAWSAVCEDPCDRALPLDAEYRIANGHSLGEFRLEAAPGGQHVELSVQRRSEDRSSGGLLLLVVGPIAMGAGAIAASLANDPSIGFSWTPPPPCHACAIGGGIAIAAGAASVVAGILLLVGNVDRMALRTVPNSAAPEMPSRPDTAWLRVPGWCETDYGGTARARTVEIPILSRTF